MKTKHKPKTNIQLQNCSYVCAYHYVQLSYTTQHRTVLIIFPLILQTIIIAQMMSTGCLLKQRGPLQTTVSEDHCALQCSIYTCISDGFHTLQSMRRERILAIGNVR